MQKFPIKIKAVLIVLFLVTVIISISFNVFLATKKKEISRHLSLSINQQLSIKNIIYLPPNFLILKGISINEQGEKNAEVFSLRFITSTFSLQQLIIKKNFLFKSITFYSLRAESLRFFSFIKGNYDLLVELLKSLSPEDINIALKDIILLPQEGQGGVPIKAGVSINFRNKVFVCSGKARKGNAPLRFFFNGILTNSGYSLEKAELSRDDFYLQFAGIHENDSLKLNGLVLINTVFKNNKPKKEKFAFWRLAHSVKLPKADLRIFDIDAKINFNPGEIELERASFFIDKNPGFLKGKITFAEKPLLEAEFSYMPSFFMRTEDFNQLNLRIKGTLEESEFNGEAGFFAEFNKKSKKSPLLENISLQVDGLKMGFFSYPDFKIASDKITFKSQASNSINSVELSDCRAYLRHKNEKLKTVDFKAILYDGYLKGGGTLDLSFFPAKAGFLVRIKDINAFRLDSLIPAFSKVFGRISCRMNFGNYPKLKLKGVAEIENGFLNDFDFFKWLADFFDLPFLKKVYFKHAALRFITDENQISLKEIDLESRDLKLNGFFSLDRNRFVSGKVSMLFDKELLRESSKLSPIVNMLSHDLKSLSFDFQISGILRSMNFKWLHSEFKKELQRLLPDRWEARIEKNLEALIESVSTKQ